MTEHVDAEKGSYEDVEGLVWPQGAPDWMPALGSRIGGERAHEVARLEADLERQLSHKRKRFLHSLSVGLTAERLAWRYGVDPYLARVSGVLHDWMKALPHDEMIARARALGIDLGVDLELVEPLLHGMVAARELPARYPELPAEVWHAIARHTLGDARMSPLDMVLFVADGIEPRRGSAPALDAQRAHVATLSLEDLFWESFADGVAYVIDTRRYLYPGTLTIYNDIALGRRAGAGKETA